MREQLRIRAPSAPKLYPFTNLHVSHGPMISTEAESQAQFLTPRKAGADGIVVWTDFFSTQCLHAPSFLRPCTSLSCEEYARVFNQTVGVVLQQAAGGGLQLGKL